MRHDPRPIRATTRRPRRLRARRGSCSPAHSLRVLPRSHAHARGQSIVEFALAIPIFLALLFGTVDMGLIFKTRSAYQEAAQQGMLAATAANGTDQQALDAIKTTLVGENLRNLVSVTIYKATSNGAFYAPSDPTTYTIYTYDAGSAAFVCQHPAAPLPAPQGPPCASATTWSGTRNTTAGPGYTLDTLGVGITFQYRSITGAFPPITMTQTAVGQMEPTQYGS